MKLSGKLFEQLYIYIIRSFLLLAVSGITTSTSQVWLIHYYFAYPVVRQLSALKVAQRPPARSPPTQVPSSPGDYWKPASGDIGGGAPLLALLQLR